MLNAVQIAANVEGVLAEHETGFVDDIKVTGYTQGGIVPLPVPTPVASVSVVPGSASVQVGQAVQFAATPRDNAGNPLAGRAITWSSSDPAVATVDGTGRASGVSAGTAIVTRHERGTNRYREPNGYRRTSVASNAGGDADCVDAGLGDIGGGSDAAIHGDRPDE